MLNRNILNKFIQSKYTELSDAYLTHEMNVCEKNLYSSNIDMSFDYVAIYNLGPKITYRTVYLITRRDGDCEKAKYFITKQEITSLIAKERKRLLNKI